MEILIEYVEILGAVAFAISGAAKAIKNNMDLFGTIVLAVTTTIGGGMLRDITLGHTPPSVFDDPTFAIIAVVTAIVIFIPGLRHAIVAKRRVYDMVILVTDSAGLGVFTACGVRTVLEMGFDGNMFLVIFAAVLTAVGGGVLRDLFAGERPYIFVKHIYACAAIVGALLCYYLWDVIGQEQSILISSAVVFAIRILAAHFRWSLPKTHGDDLTENEKCD